MLPCLAAQDPRQATRRAAIARDRDRYIFQHVYKCEALPTGLAMADHLPEGDGFDARFYEAAAPLDLRVAINSLLVQLLEVGEDLLTHTHSHTLLGLLGIEREMPSGRPFPRTGKALQGINASFPADLSAYDGLYKALPLPAVAGVLESSPLLQDRLFAWQRLAGANPLVITCVRRIPPRTSTAERVVDAAKNFIERLAKHSAGIEHMGKSGDLPPDFMVTDAHVQKTLPKETLASLADQGRLFVCDYSATLNLPLGTYNSGILGITRDKQLYSPFALFAWVPASDKAPGFLQPLAIQCQPAGVHTDVFTPRDGIAWKMAKTVVQQADATTQELISHLARTHLILEGVLLSCRREMAPWHPVRVLIDAHGYNTLAINDFAAHHLIAPGGQVDHVFSATLEGNLEMAARGLAAFSFDELSPHAQLEARGLGDGAMLDEYPWRDDSLLLWPIVERFVERYLRTYYSADADVVGDDELQAFFHSLGADDGACLPKVPEVKTINALVGALARIVWTATAQHACLNNSQFDHLGYAPEAPGALYAEAPGDGKPLAQSDWMKMLPPVSAAMTQLSLLYQVANVRMEPLGHFPEGTFVDPRVQDTIKRYQSELSYAETVLVGRDRTRFLPYPYLRPNQIGNSVFI
jgi:arachidonate 15-lipoxygenase